ncbi:MAG: C25 family cysteine peptidase [Acidobacteriota bacterium]
MSSRLLTEPRPAPSAHLVTASGAARTAAVFATAVLAAGLLAPSLLAQAPYTPVCGAPGADGSAAALTGVVNTYYAGVVGTVSAGAFSIPVGASRGAATPIATGDLLLVMQMQDATIDSTDTSSYGDGVAGGVASGATSYANSGRWELVIAGGPVASGSVPILGAGTGFGTVYSYTQAAPTASRGQRRYQVIRVPQYEDAGVGVSATLTAAAWDGETGGVLALAVADLLTLQGTLDVSELGFRGGLGRQLGGAGGGSGTAYRSLSSGAFHGPKAEGVAGTSRYLYDAIAAAAVNTGVEGYPNGDHARGAPGNAGGGGTDSRPSNNDQNSGGGGGGNGGAGGSGGNTWSANATTGGFGGAAFPAALDRLALGGGGGAATRNNSTANQSSGGTGGGAIFVFTGRAASSGTLVADGGQGPTPANDGGGGGGAGGSLVVLATDSSGLASFGVSARGADGTDAWPTQPPGSFPGERHGPGGGGGGGYVVSSGSFSSLVLAGGAAGTSTTAADVYGAQPGAAGASATSSFSALDVRPDEDCLDLDSDGDGTSNRDEDFNGDGDPNNDCIVGGRRIPCYLDPGVLPVSLASFDARSAPGGLRFEWWTATETSTVGYRVLGRIGDAWTPLGAPIPALSTDSLTPRRYVHLADALGATSFMLEEIDTRGRPTRHGPFGLGQHGRQPRPSAIDWPSVRAELQSFERLERVSTARWGRRPVAALRVEHEGIYRVAWDDLAAVGVPLRGPVDQLALSTPGGPVALWVDDADDDALFGPGDAVEFVGEPVRGNLATRTQVYRLLVDPRTALRLVPPRAAGVERSIHVDTVELDRPRGYSFAAPGDDPWYDTQILSWGAPASARFDLQLDATVEPTRAQPARLEVEVWGATDWPRGGPDHHVVVSFDGVEVAAARFDGIRRHRLVAELPPELLSDGRHQVEVSLPGDTGHDFDLVQVDRLRVVHPRRLVARDGALAFESSAGRLRIDGMRSAEASAWVETTAGWARLDALRLEPGPNGFRVSFEGVSTTARYLVADAGARRVPAIAPARIATRSELAPSGADLLIVAHPLFVDGVEPLARARRDQGLRVEVVDVHDVYAAYSGEVVSVAPIAALIRDAASRGVGHVLLVGGDTHDPLDHLGLGSVAFLPTPYTATDELIRFAPVDPLYGDLDGDGVPEIPIGRLPVRTEAELDAVLAKILTVAAAPSRAVFASDDSPRGVFRELSTRFAAELPASWSARHVDLDHRPVGTARGELLTAVSDGAALVSFVGHSGPSAWTFDGLFDAADVPLLRNDGAPATVVQWGCWNTYHVAPEYDTLGHLWLLTSDVGAAAVIGSATLTAELSDRLLGPLVHRRLLEPGVSLGAAITAAKQELAADYPHLRDVLLGWTLLGDPSMVMTPPGGDLGPRR